MIAPLHENANGGTGEAGFTLVELLAALALLSLLSVMALGSVRFALAVSDRAVVYSQQLDGVVPTQDLVRRLLQDAYPAFLVVDAQGRVDFEGERGAVRFLAPTPVALGLSGRSRMTITTLAAGHRNDLVLVSQHEFSVGSAEVPKRILVEDIQDIEIDYFGAPRTDRAPSWQGSWKEQTVLPQLVRLRVKFRDGDRRTWPDLVIAPRIAVDVGCFYDALTNQCRGRLMTP
jgi:general secretion pathway protein J